MNPDNSKPLLKSETVLWIVGTMVAYASAALVKRYGIPGLPADVQAELSNFVLMALDASIPIMSLMAIRARKRATSLINGWWR